MDNEKPKASSKVLFIVLTSFITLVLIILFIIIIIISNRNENNDFTEAVSELPVELQSNDLSPQDEVIKETSIMLGDPNYSNSDIEAYYDKVINQAIEDDNNDFALSIIIQKINFLVTTEKDCDKVKKYSNEIDLSRYSNDQKGYLASYAISAISDCNDAELETMWNNVYASAE